MDIQLKKIIISLFFVLLGSCSSEYSPNESVRAIQKTMNVAQAVDVLQDAIWARDKAYGVCGSRGFWFDDASAMQVKKDKVKMIAHKRGPEIKKFNQSFSDVVVFEKQYYRYEFNLNKISKINIYRDARLLPVFPGCNKKELAHEYLIIDLYINKLSNLKFVVKKSDFDKTMAAILTLLPNKDIEVKG